MQHQNIPYELRQRAQWLCWRYKELPNGRQTKPPCSAHTGEITDATARTSWGTIEQALATAERYGLGGIGYALSKDDPYTVIDIDDHPHKPLTNEQQERHRSILRHFNSYTERSVSGRGYHIVVRGKIPGIVQLDSVDLYPSDHYVVFTGDMVRGPDVVDYAADIRALYDQMQAARPRVYDFDRQDEPQTLSDQEVIARAMHAVNGAKFASLARGEWSTAEYPSQSEADLALLSMLCFYSRNDEQVKRIFRLTQLSKRDKAQQDDRYLDRTIKQRIRPRELPSLDFEEFTRNAMALIEENNAASEPVSTVEETQPPSDPIKAQGVGGNSHRPSPYTFPPGMLGDIADYIYKSARRPNKEIALASAIALMAGVTGRNYNISGLGLAQYILIVGKTGLGKQDGTNGIERMFTAAAASVPTVDTFQGPGAFASAQSIVQSLQDRPVCVSVLNEFADTLNSWLDPRAPAPVMLIRRVLLDVISKTGWGDYLRPTAFADKTKNTAVVQAPNLTIYGDTTPSKFYDALSSRDIADGFLPRFTVIETNERRVRNNKQAGFAPAPELAQRFTELCQIAIQMRHNMVCQTIDCDDKAERLLDAFDLSCDDRINNDPDPTESELWNRAHAKALRIAGLVAVGVSPHKPCVTEHIATWAIKFVTDSTIALSERFGSGDVGHGDSKQRADLTKIIKAYFAYDPKTLRSYGSSAEIRAQGLIPYKYFLIRASKFASFYSDRNGAARSLQSALQAACDSGELAQLIAADAVARTGSVGKVYAVTRA